MDNSPCCRSVPFYLVSLIVLISILLGACQVQVATSPNLPPTSTSLPATQILPKATPTLTPSPSPTALPLTLWLDPILPNDFRKKLDIPEGILTTRLETEANLFLTAGDPPDSASLLGETWQTYALVHCAG